MNLNVYVPNGTLASYQNADVWKLFWNLQEKDFTGTGIDAVELKKATSESIGILMDVGFQLLSEV